jgi:hypothetical protein
MGGSFICTQRFEYPCLSRLLARVVAIRRTRIDVSLRIY